jgi:hypothetical protein
MARVTRLELATSGVTGQRSNQLSYTPSVLTPDLGQSHHQVKWLIICFINQMIRYISRYTDLSFLQKMVGDERLELPTSSV